LRHHTIARESGYCTTIEPATFANGRFSNPELTANALSTCTLAVVLGALVGMNARHGAGAQWLVTSGKEAAIRHTRRAALSIVRDRASQRLLGLGRRGPCLDALCVHQDASGENKSPLERNYRFRRVGFQL
jgi:hypothetical protein